MQFGGLWWNLARISVKRVSFLRNPIHFSCNFSARNNNRILYQELIGISKKPYTLLSLLLHSDIVQFLWMSAVTRRLVISFVFKGLCVPARTKSYKSFITFRIYTLQALRCCILFYYFFLSCFFFGGSSFQYFFSCQFGNKFIKQEAAVAFIDWHFILLYWHIQTEM